MRKYSNKTIMGATIFGTIAVMILTIASALGQTEVYNRKYCLDDTTLMWVRNITFVVPETNTTRTLIATEPQICPNGCQNDVCMDPPWVTYAWIFGILIVAATLYLVFRPR